MLDACVRVWLLMFIHTHTQAHDGGELLLSSSDRPAAFAPAHTSSKAARATLPKTNGGDSTTRGALSSTTCVMSRALM